MAVQHFTEILQFSRCDRHKSLRLVQVKTLLPCHCHLFVCRRTTNPKNFYILSCPGASNFSLGSGKSYPLTGHSKSHLKNLRTNTPNKSPRFFLTAKTAISKRSTKSSQHGKQKLNQRMDQFVTCSISSPCLQSIQVSVACSSCTLQSSMIRSKRGSAKASLLAKRCS